MNILTLSSFHSNSHAFATFNLPSADVWSGSLRLWRAGGHWWCFVCGRSLHRAKGVLLWRPAVWVPHLWQSSLAPPQRIHHHDNWTQNRPHSGDRTGWERISLNNIQIWICEMKAERQWNVTILCLVGAQVSIWWPTPEPTFFPPAIAQSSPPLFVKESPGLSVCNSGITWEEGILVRHLHAQNTHKEFKQNKAQFNCVYSAGSLTVYMKPVKGERVKIFSDSLNQGHVWRHGNGNISSTLVDWQVLWGGWKGLLEQL